MPVIFSDLELEYCRHIFENIQMSNFMKIRPVGTELFRARRQDRQSDKHS